MAVVPPLPSHFVDGDTLDAAEVNAIIDNVALNGPAVQMPPNGHAVHAWTADPVDCSAAGITMTSGTLYLFRWYQPVSILYTGLEFYVNTAGVTPSTGNAAALFDDTGLRIAITGDIASSFTSTGAKLPAFSPGGVTPLARTYGWVGLLWRGTTSPVIAAKAAAANTGIANINSRRILTLASQTTIPASVTIASLTLASQVGFMAAY